MERCYHFKEHGGCQQKYPTGPVTWDAHCSKCGFSLEDRDFSNGLAIEGNGRRLAYVCERLEVGVDLFYGERFIACSECVPALLGKVED